MQLELFNTETRKKEKILPSQGETIRIYTCGPTVYNYAHIGNFRTYIFEDLLRRTLEFFGYRVHQVMNITDIDDKTIKGALQEGTSLEAFTQKYTEAFFADLAALHIQKAQNYPKATAYIPEMIQMIEELIKKGHAYKAQDGSVYFSIHSFPRYGRLSHLTPDSLKVGASDRIHQDEYDKDAASDFVLWKAYDPQRDGMIFWQSPFGKGRPGWHIECSTMARALLGDQIDIHCGGVDNMFPHHENEIAQSECCSGVVFALHWAHAEHLLVEGKKMSKSLGNFYTLRDLISAGYTGEEVRYLLLSGHYRTQLNFTFDGLKAARASLERIRDLLYRLETCTEDLPEPKTIEESITECRNEFSKAIADDMNMPQALSAVFEMVRTTNSAIDRHQIGPSGAKKIHALFEDLDRVLGCLPLQKIDTIPPMITEALQRRELARKEKNWAVADEMRALIQKSGYTIEDGPHGPRVKRQ